MCWKWEEVRWIYMGIQNIKRIWRKDLWTKARRQGQTSLGLVYCQCDIMLFPIGTLESNLAFSICMSRLTNALLIFKGLRNNILLPALMYGQRRGSGIGHSNHECVLWKWLSWQGRREWQDGMMRDVKACMEDVVWELMLIRWWRVRSLWRKNMWTKVWIQTAEEGCLEDRRNG